MTSPPTSMAFAAGHGLVMREGFAPVAPGPRVPTAARSPVAGASQRIGIVSNPRSHRNRREGHPTLDGIAGDVRLYRPDRLADLMEGIADFARSGVDLIVIDGGDGTIRDVLTCAGHVYGERLPRFAIVPSGKTNALAIDIGLPADWTLTDAVAAARAGRVAWRSPLEVARADSVEPDLRGFLLGAGGFVRATALAQRTHRAGAFRGVAVAMSLAGAMAQTLLGGRDNPWRKGDPMRLSGPGIPPTSPMQYLLLATTIERLPLGIKPFGPEREGLKLLSVDAPPRRLAASLPAILRGTDCAVLAARGYRRIDTDRFVVEMDGGFILDGELYHGGAITVRRGAPVAFAIP